MLSREEALGWDRWWFDITTVLGIICESFDWIVAGVRADVVAVFVVEELRWGARRSCPRRREKIRSGLALGHPWSFPTAP